MGLLMLISNQDGILTIEPIVDQVKESFLQKSLQIYKSRCKWPLMDMTLNNIKETLNAEVDS